MTGNTSLLDNIQQILEGLKKTPEGMTLHTFIMRGLRKFGDARVELAFLVFANKLLERYLTSPESHPPTRIKVRVIQQRLRPYIDELLALAATTPADPGPPDRGAPPPAAQPPEPVNPPAQVAPDMKAEPPPAATAEPASTTAPSPHKRKSAYEATLTPRTPPAVDSPTEASVPAGGDNLPEQLALHMAQSLTRGRDLDDMLRSALAALEQSGASSNLAELKQQLRSGVEELIAERRNLEHDLIDTRRGLQAVSADRRQLSQALDQARKHSMTDELTGLPNRHAFTRQLHAEIGRARRYGFSLALALIDVDDLKSVNERYGQTGGDAVLHAYANQIMAQFRGYDIVARYGEDEFVVLLPNTQKEGASRAIEKAQKHAAGTYIHLEGRNIPLPSFSSVLTLYAHGEAPDALLKRADEALGLAKQRGRAQSVIALPAG